MKKEFKMNIPQPQSPWTIPNIVDCEKVKLIFIYEKNGMELESQEYFIPKPVLSGKDNLTSSGDLPNYCPRVISRLLDEYDDGEPIELRFQNDPEVTFKAFRLIFDYITECTQLRDSSSPELTTLEKCPYKDIIYPLELLPTSLENYMDAWQKKYFGDAYSTSLEKKQEFFAILMKAIELGNKYQCEWFNDISHALVCDVIKNFEETQVIEIFKKCDELTVPEGEDFKSDIGDKIIGDDLDMSIVDEAEKPSELRKRNPHTLEEDEYGASGSGLHTQEKKEDDEENDDEEDDDEDEEEDDDEDDDEEKDD